jgi:hypothetical protein
LNTLVNFESAQPSQSDQFSVGVNNDNVNSFSRRNFANDLTANAGFAIGVG